MLIAKALGRAQLASELSHRIRKLREEQGLTRAQLARDVGVSFAAVFQWEENDRQPRHDALSRLAEVLGVSLHYLVKGTEGQQNEPKPAKTSVKDILKQAQIQLAAAMGLPLGNVRVTVEEVIGPRVGKTGRRHSTD